MRSRSCATQAASEVVSLPAMDQTPGQRTPPRPGLKPLALCMLGSGDSGWTSSSHQQPGRFLRSWARRAGLALGRWARRGLPSGRHRASWIVSGRGCDMTWPAETGSLSWTEAMPLRNISWSVLHTVQRGPASYYLGCRGSSTNSRLPVGVNWRAGRCTERVRLQIVQFQGRVMGTEGLSPFYFHACLKWSGITMN